MTLWKMKTLWKQCKKGMQNILDGVNPNQRSKEQRHRRTFLESMGKVDAYARLNGLGEEVGGRSCVATLVQGADDMLNGIFSDSFIETMAKGLSHDADVQEAADTGFVEGKNEKVEMKYGKGEGDGMPSMGNTSNSLRKPVAKAKEKKKFVL